MSGKMMYLISNCVLAGLLTTAALAVSAYAQDDGDIITLEEILVTAEKKETRLQKTAISITALSGENIREMGKVNADEVLKDVPNVIVQREARGYGVAIRGLGSDLQPGVGESSVSTNFDGVYSFRAEAGALGYYDLARVEVLRGPQGTLYGRNATAGVVNVVSKDPGDDFEGYGTVELGNYSLLRTEGAVNIPISNELSARMAFVSITRDGYLSNGQDDAVGSGARLKMRYEPGKNVKVVFSSEYTKLGGFGPGSTEYVDYLAGNPYLSQEPENLTQNYESYKFSANVQFSAGPGVITFIPSYQSAEGTQWIERNGATEISYDPLSGEAKSAELRYASESEAKIQWVTGLYYYDMEESRLGNNNPTVRTDMLTAYAAFGQITVPLSDTLRGILGARLGHDEKSYHNISVDPSFAEDDWTAFDWKAGLEVDLAENVLGYLTLATGHRAGGFNSSSLAGDLTGTSFDPEDLMSAELGLKSRFMNNRLQINTDVFYYDYNNYQVSDFWKPEGSFKPVSIFYNASSVENYGAELESEMLLTDWTVGKFSLTYLNSEYKDDFILHSSYAPYIANLKGHKLPHSPKWTAKFGIEHTIDMGRLGSLTPSFDVRWTDDQYVGVFPSEYALQKAYTIYDVALRYLSADTRWSLNLYMKNIGDEAYKQAAQSTGSVRVSSPRTTGLVISAKF